MLTELVEGCACERLASAVAATDTTSMVEALSGILGRNIELQRTEKGWIMDCPPDEVESLGKLVAVVFLPTKDDKAATAEDDKGTNSREGREGRFCQRPPELDGFQAAAEIPAGLSLQATSEHPPCDS